MAGTQPLDSVAATTSGAVLASGTPLRLIPGGMAAVSLATSSLGVGLILALLLLAYWYRRVL